LTSFLQKYDNYSELPKNFLNFFIYPWTLPYSWKSPYRIRPQLSVLQQARRGQ